MNRRGAVVIPDTHTILASQRERIRQLEANPSGGFSIPWTVVPFSAYQNGWAGDPSAGETDEYQDPDCAYMRDAGGFVSLRGRLFTPTSGSLGGGWFNGAKAFTLSSDVAPEYDQWFHCDGSDPLGFTFDFGDGGSNLLVRANGEVIPFINQAGLSTGDPRFQNPTITFGGGHTILDPFQWWNTPANDFGLVSGGGFGVVGGPIGPGNNVAVLRGFNSQLGPTDVTVKWAGGTQVILGLMVQPQSAVQRPSASLPDGFYWVLNGVTAGSSMAFLEVRGGQQATIVTSTGFIPNQFLPINLTPGIELTFRRTHMNLMFYIGGGRTGFGTKAGDYVGVIPFDITGAAMNRGMVAIGGNGPADTALFSEMTVGMAGSISCCLDGVTYKAAA